MKQYCVKQILLQVSRQNIERILEAERVLCAALERVEPIPNEPMYESIHIAACDLLRDAILAPELTLLEKELAATTTLAELTKNTPRLRRRVAAYDSTLNQQANELGKGICAVLSSRNQEDSLAHCVRRAKQAAHEALASWVSSVKDANANTKEAVVP
jgi:uncharacterized protein (UPF0147 family)